MHPESKFSDNSKGHHIVTLNLFQGLSRKNNIVLKDDETYPPESDSMNLYCFPKNQMSKNSILIYKSH